MRCDPRPHHGLLEIRQRSGYPACRAGSEGARRQPLPRRADVLPVRRAGASLSEHGRRHDDRCDSRPRGRPHRGSANARRAGGPVTITMPNITVWIFIGYLTVLVAIRFGSERFTKGLEGFVLGDRKMGPWLTALAYESTAYSGWLMLGLPGKAFKYGLAAVWVCISCVLGDALNWALVSRRLRDETARLRSMTIPEYLERRFQKPNGYAIQLAASLEMSVFMLIYLWAQFVASGKTIMAMLQWNYVPAGGGSCVVTLLVPLRGGVVGR